MRGRTLIAVNKATWMQIVTDGVAVDLDAQPRFALAFVQPIVERRVPGAASRSLRQRR